MRIDENSVFSNKAVKFVNISDLKDGDVFRAEVLDIKQNEMTLKLLGTNSTINAKTAKILGLKIGELVNFKVTSNNNKQLVLEPIINSSDSNVYSTILKQNKNLDMDKLLILMKNNIPITEDNIENLNSFINQNKHLNFQIEDILKNLANFSKFKINLENNTLTNLNELYKNLYKLVSSLLDDKTATEKIKDTAIEVKQKLEFTTQILNNDTYLEIPLKFNKNDYNPELYILKNKKHKLATSNITALLCLDLPKLGYTEVLINKNLNNINCKFRLENLGSKETFVRHMNDLKIRLSAMGYNLINVAYENLQEKANILNKGSLLFNDGKDEGRIRSFDIRV